MAGPIVTRRDQVGEPLANIARLWHRHGNSTTPHVLGNADALASSPKSLSKVSRMRPSRAAHARTSASLIPGAAILIHTTSCPAAASAVTVVPGKFSLARKRMSGCAGEDLLGTQCITRVRKTGNDVVVSYSGVIRHDVGLVPSVGHQSDHEFDREPVPRMTGFPASTVRASAMRECSLSSRAP